MEGARVSKEEALRADDLLAEANRLIVAAQEGLPGEDGKPADPRAAADRRLRLERAEDLIRQALAQDPSHSSARMTRAVLLYEDLGRSLEARQELGRIVDRAEFDPGDPNAARKFANYHLGVIALRERRWEKASLRFTQSLQYDPAFLDAMVGQGDAYLGLALSEEVALEDKRRADEAKAAGREPPTPTGVDSNLDAARQAFSSALGAIEAEHESLLGMVSDLQRAPDKSFEESQVIQAVKKSQDALNARQAALHFRLGRIHAARMPPDDRRALQSYREAAGSTPTSPTTARRSSCGRSWSGEGRAASGRAAGRRRRPPGRLRDRRRLRPRPPRHENRQWFSDWDRLVRETAAQAKTTGAPALERLAKDGDQVAIHHLALRPGARLAAPPPPPRS